MKQIVYESLNEFQGIKRGFQKGVEKIKGFLKTAFEKVKGFFVAMSNGEPVNGVMLPINTGILVDKGALSPAISYLPSPVDMELEPTLGSERAEDIIEKRGEDLQKIEEALQLILEDRVALEHPDPDVPNVDVKGMMRRIRMKIRNPMSQPLLIWGAPGIGKTKIVKGVLEALDGELRLIDVQTSKMAPDDWALPAVKELKTGWAAMDVPKNWLPVYTPTGDPEEDAKRNDAANMGNGGVIFFDELSRANDAVQATCLKVMDERIIGDSVLGDKWVIIAAANRDQDDPETDINFGTALGNRFAQINFVPDFESWKGWASGRVDDRIVDFLEFNREDFYNLSDEDGKYVFASPRSWANASQSIAMLMQDAEAEGYKPTRRDYAEVVGSDVGLGVAERLSAFLALMETWSPEDLKKIFTDPEKARLPKKAGSGYDLAESNAVLSLLVTSTKDRTLTPLEWENFAKYLVKMDNASLASAGVKKIFQYHPYMHEELGERPGHDKYQKGYDIFADKYKDAF